MHESHVDTFIIRHALLLQAWSMEETTAQLFAGGFAITILAFLVALRDQVTAVVPHVIREPS